MSVGQIFVPILFRGPNGVIVEVGAQQSQVSFSKLLSFMFKLYFIVSLNSSLNLLYFAFMQCYASWYASCPGLKVLFVNVFIWRCLWFLKATIRYPLFFLKMSCCKFFCLILTWVVFLENGFFCLWFLEEPIRQSNKNVRFFFLFLECWFLLRARFSLILMLEIFYNKEEVLSPEKNILWNKSYPEICKLLFSIFAPCPLVLNLFLLPLLCWLNLWFEYVFV